ncbi:MAG: hypothetical protein Q4F15_04875 [Bacillota bacterium]|nr:hypothetical protein [Bacillota bacterium]
MKIFERIKSSKLGHYFFGEYDGKTIAFGLLSLAISLFFMGLNLFYAIYAWSLWYAILTGYYLCLILFRGSIIPLGVRARKKHEGDESGLRQAERRIYLLSGFFIFILFAVMAIAISELIIHGKPGETGTIMAIATAAYTFYKTGLAIYNLAKSRRIGDWVSQSLRNLNFADALMSMVSLTVTMLATFGDSGDYALTIEACTGFGAAVLVLGLSIYTIVEALKSKEKGD